VFPFTFRGALFKIINGMISKNMENKNNLKTDSFVLHGVRVVFSCGHDEIHEKILQRFSAYTGNNNENGVDCEINIDISYGDVIYPVPLHAKRVLRYGPLRSYLIDDLTFFTDYFSTLAIDSEGKSIKGNLSPETLKDFGTNYFIDLLFTLTLFEALRFHGLYYLHGAVLEGPDGTGYLISGNAGSGKTTLTMSLIESGFRFLSDDTVFLRLSGDSDVEIRGLARDFHVPTDLIRGNDNFKKYEVLPDYSSYKKKKTLKPDEWFPEQRLDKLINPDIILFPRIKNGEVLAAMDQMTAFTELMPQSLAVMCNPNIAPLHLEAIKRTLKHGKAFRLRHGLALKGKPDLVKSVFEDARDMAADKEKK
jgi:hypothetical protein